MLQQHRHFGVKSPLHVTQMSYNQNQQQAMQSIYFTNINAILLGFIKMYKKVVPNEDLKP